MSYPFSNSPIKVNSLILILVSITFIFFYVLKGFLIQSSLSIALFVGVFLHLLNKIGKDLPIKELMILMLSLQLLISPLITYHYFNNDMEFIMFVEEGYYVWFVLLHIIMFSIGLLTPIFKKNERYNKLDIPINHINGKIGLFLILFGFASYFLGKIMPPSFHFIFYLFSYSRLIGALIILYSNLKGRYLWFSLTFLHFSYIIISGAIFYDLIIWAFFFYMVFEIKFKSSFLRKVIIATIGIFGLLFLQSIKSDYRKEVWAEDKIEKTSNIKAFVNVATQSQLDKDEKSNFEHLVTRLNTGWIISAVLIHVPNYQGFTNGQLLLDDLKNVLLPRFLAPNKKSVGGKENREKFEKFTGRRLGDDTTMRVGVIADAYINFGPVGGAFLMLVFGFIINLTIGFFKKFFFNTSSYFWILFIFSFTVRMSDFIVIINSTFKSILIFIFIMFMIKKLIPQTDT